MAAEKQCQVMLHEFWGEEEGEEREKDSRGWMARGFARYKGRLGAQRQCGEKRRGCGSTTLCCEWPGARTGRKEGPWAREKSGGDQHFLVANTTVVRRDEERAEDRNWKGRKERQKDTKRGWL